jgi:tetratricopeptide (TPR) repeat protein
MKHQLLTVTAIIASCFFSSACSEVESKGETDLASVPVAVTNSRYEDVKKAESVIEKMPESAAGYRALAMAYIRLSRETGDPSYSDKAMSAIESGLERQADDGTLLRLKATVLLATHEFSQAREIGVALEKQSPKDPFVLGILTDANAELGNYQDAAKYAQKMVDARPDSQSYARAAHIRSLFGDHNGAVELYILAAKTADPADREAQAWCLSQLGNEYWRNGKYSQSLAVYEEALQIFPDYHLALFGKGRSLVSTGDLAAAKTALAHAQERLPMLETVILLGNVAKKLGEADLAAAQFAMADAGEEKLGAHYDEHRMALLWADQDRNLDKALEVALADFEEIKDIYASDILAWCHYKKGNFAAAREQITLAMRIKTRDARIRYHAGMIEMALGNKVAAKKHLTDAMAINPEFDLIKSASARETLSRL